MINTIKKSWKDVTIDEYFDLCERLSDDTLTDYEKIIIKIAFITGKNEDEIWNLTWTEFRELQVEALWMDEFQLKENVKFKSIEINGEKYSIDTNLQNFTVAQYIDFQTFFPKRKENQRIIGNILACFIIPQGKKYAEDYDIKELVDNINSNLDIMTANEILFFFLKQYLISIRATANYFNWVLKRMKKKSKNKEEVEKLEMEWEKVKKVTLIGLRSLTMLDN
ncbi:MAG: hypothetical protein IIU99_05430 [Treponema sp.]|nr:hypothetical protein [Treponema sp.]